MSWAHASPRPGTSSTSSADRSATPCSAACSTTSTSPPTPGPSRPSGCSRGGRTPSGTWVARSAPSAAARASGRWRSPRTARRPTTRPPASPTSTSATRSPVTWDDATSRSTRWRSACPDRRFEDPYGGVVDLAHRLLRTPGRPEDSFSDDPLRMMRAARFSAQLGFTVAPEVVEAMRAMAGADRDHLRRAGPRRAGQAGLRAVPAPRPDPAGRDRAGRPRAARAARRWRWSVTSTTGTRTSTSTPSRCWSRRSRWRTGWRPTASSRARTSSPGSPR